MEHKEKMAFPCLKPTGFTTGKGDQEFVLQQGMTLRQYYAIEILKGLLSSETIGHKDSFVKMSFLLADEMIKHETEGK